jgi:hypothetical protein
MTIAQTYSLFSPNWTTPVGVTYEWKTGIKRGITGNERRSQFFSWPRRSVAYEMMFKTAEERMYFINNFFPKLHWIWGVPLWPEVSYLTSQATSGQAVLNLDTTYRSFYPGQSVILVADKDTYEVGIILSKTDSSITLTTNLVSTWNAESVVYPLLQTRADMSNTVLLKHDTSSIGNLNVRFRETYEADAMYVAGTHNFPSYNGFPVFNKEPNWNSVVNCNVSRASEILEDLGISHSYSHQSISDILVTNNYNLYTRQECYEFETFFNTMGGRAGQIWVPTWQNDIPVNAAVDSADTVLSTDDFSYSTLWLPNDVIGRVVFFSHPDGTEAYRIIINATSSTITLDSAIGFDVSAVDLPGFISCFLLPARFNIDQLDMSYKTNTVATAKVSFLSQNDEEMAAIIP